VAAVPPVAVLERYTCKRISAVMIHENPLDVCLISALIGFWNEPECSNTLFLIFTNVLNQGSRSAGANWSITCSEFTSPWLRSRLRVFADEHDKGVLLMLSGAIVGGKACANEGSGIDSEIILPSAATIRRRRLLLALSAN
jgi:hypothetical protein